MKRVRPIYSETFVRRRRWQRALLGLLLLLMVAGTVYATFIRTPRPNRDRYPVMGVRLDQSDGYQDFAALKAHDVQFAYLKGTEGASYFDDNFTSNFHRAIGSGVAVGVYHFFSFASTPEAQANYLIRQVGDRTGQLPLAVYVEKYTTLPKKATLNANLTTFLTRIETHYGRPCVVMGKAGILRHVKAAIGQRDTITVGQHPGKTSQFWEYSQSARVGDHQYRAMVFTGAKTAFTALLPAA